MADKATLARISAACMVVVLCFDIKFIQINTASGSLARLFFITSSPIEVVISRIFASNLRIAIISGSLSLFF